jgi:hypothetical protein
MAADKGLHEVISALVHLMSDAGRGYDRSAAVCKSSVAGDGMKRDVGSEREKLPMRRSRRWIELSAAAGKISQEPRGREDGDVPADQSGDAVPLDGPRRAQDDNDTMPPAPLMLLSEMSVLAARIALSAAVESGKVLRALTARSAQAGRLVDRD